MCSIEVNVRLTFIFYFHKLLHVDVVQYEYVYFYTKQNLCLQFKKCIYFTLNCLYNRLQMYVGIYQLCAYNIMQTWPSYYVFYETKQQY